LLGGAALAVAAPGHGALAQARRPGGQAMQEAVSILPALATSRDPIFGPGTYDRTLGGLRYYEQVVANGGWKPLPRTAERLRLGDAGPNVPALAERLMLSGDLDRPTGEIFEPVLEAALQRFQRRHGLTQTGAIGPLTLRALNVPAAIRLRQLRATMARMANNGFPFPDRYVVVNIPAATVEAVEGGAVARRHIAVVGRPDRPSPVLDSRIPLVTLNPTWTVPPGILRKDIMPKVRRNLGFLAANNMRVFDGAGNELDPASIDWSGRSGINFWVRQDPGPTNALGAVRIDMPNNHAVYLHDTPKKELFGNDVRFNSSGCARVQDVADLAAWLLSESGINRRDIQRGIDAERTINLRMVRPVPVAWVYLTAWGDDQGDVQFREDVYNLDDSARDIQATTLAPRPPRPPVAGAAVAQAPARRARPIIDSPLALDAR
jgi:murein L,D-transpeptidase YcbB/YkuD